MVGRRGEGGFHGRGRGSDFFVGLDWIDRDTLCDNYK